MRKKAKKNLFIIGVILTLISVSIAGYFLYLKPEPRDIKLRYDVELPSFTFVSARTAEAYRIALTVPEVLEKVPCTCGCNRIGHKSDKDCFINPEGGFSDHASHCNICVDIAFDAFRWYRDGYSNKQIRKGIDAKYLKFGEPTPTPPVK